MRQKLQWLQLLPRPHLLQHQRKLRRQRHQRCLAKWCVQCRHHHHLQWPVPVPQASVARVSMSRQYNKKLFLNVILFVCAAGDVIIDEESKRARHASNTDRLYPALSDLDSSGDNCCATTATASINDDTEQEEEELERCADKCYSCLLFLLCIE